MLRGDKDEAIRRIRSASGLNIDEMVELLDPEVDIDAAIRRDKYRQVYQFQREVFGFGENKTAFSVFVGPVEKRRFKDMQFMRQDEIEAAVQSIVRRKEGLLAQIEKLDIRMHNLRGLGQNYVLDFDERFMAQEEKKVDVK